ncbi:tyrosinase family protein [Marinoscillum pacificum]|uniref:tyrosinase family protein n=1 Tax=Marinoscillum pacificum TaxID=392723 RepID=UPI002157FBE5|nr:tyrosinase family protein [Marinoscillum pacificum]
MSVELKVNESSAPEANYVGWCPAKCTLSSGEHAGERLTLRNAVGNVGQVVFLSTLEMIPVNEITVEMPSNGAETQLFIAGKFGSPSKKDKDSTIEIIDARGNIAFTKDLMVRVRKNANSRDFTDDERDDFLEAMVELNSMNSNGVIQFRDFQNIHSNLGDNELHRRSSFLPWHRAYLLDLERELQKINPAVTLPYWRFDQPAPNIFNGDFMGTPNPSGTVEFASGNPMTAWVNRINGGSGMRIRRFHAGIVDRNPDGSFQVIPYDPTTSRAVMVNNGQDDTVNMGISPGGNYEYSLFEAMEGDPHGAAHNSFLGEISFPGSAPADPLFYMLHCNVDRLWALWQWLGNRYDIQNPDSYPHNGNGIRTNNLGNPRRIGNCLNDTMWPWNGDTTAPRPGNTFGGKFPDTKITDKPGLDPKVEQMFDYQGQVNIENQLGFTYDDIPFEF